MLKTPIGRLRAMGILEGISFLVLVGIAMPLKYLGDKPEAVEIAGWVHGVLFVAFCSVLFLTVRDRDWTIRQAAIPFVAALLPFGPFLIDRRLKREDEAARDASS